MSYQGLSDPIIDEIRAVRSRISARFEHNPGTARPVLPGPSEAACRSADRGRQGCRSQGRGRRLNSTPRMDGFRAPGTYPYLTAAGRLDHEVLGDKGVARRRLDPLERVEFLGEPEPTADVRQPVLAPAGRWPRRRRLGRRGRNVGREHSRTGVDDQPEGPVGVGEMEAPPAGAVGVALAVGVIVEDEVIHPPRTGLPVSFSMIRPVTRTPRLRAISRWTGSVPGDFPTATSAWK